MKKFLIYLILFAASLALASFLVCRFIDVNSYKSYIIASVKERTGYEICINGDLKLRIFPEISIEATDIYLKSENPQYSDNIIQIKNSVAKLKVSSLLKGAVEVGGISLSSPILKFKILKDGTNNFFLKNEIFVKKEDDKNSNYVKLFEGKLILLKDFLNKVTAALHVDDVEIENGRLWLADEQKGLDIHIDDINIKTLESKHFQASGQAKMDVGINVPVAFEATYKIAKNSYNLSDVYFKIGDIEAHGEAGVDFRAQIPDVKIAFYFDRLNLDPYSGLIALLSNVLNFENGKKNNTNNAQNKQFAWSSEPIDLNLLRTLNGRFSFKTNNFIYKKINVGVVTINTYLKNGKLTLGIREGEIFGGNINGEITADATSDITKIKNKVNFEDVDMQQFSEQTGVGTNFAGRLSGGIDLTSKGISEKELAEKISGAMSLKIENGLFGGIDIIGIDNNASSALNINKKTSFKEILGEFSVNDGIVKTDNFIIVSDTLDCRGAGIINIPQLKLDLKITPKIKNNVGNVVNQAATPVNISGGVFNPAFKLEDVVVKKTIKNKDNSKTIKRDLETPKNNTNSEIKVEDKGIIDDLKKIFSGF